ncbi:MAG: chromate efflux transporter [Parachlamydia sp.]|nr:chromate efflux transporter [Parachlamydia sp.]
MAEQKTPTFSEALRFWLLLGFISFGGPAGQISILYQELVEKRKWITRSRFLHALNYCMLLPGPEAAQLVIYIGWILHRTWGGIVAGVLFILPSVAILWSLSYVYVIYGHLDWIAAIFYGLKPAVVAIVFSAVLRIGNTALKTASMWLTAALAFIGIFFFAIPFPVIILAAAVAGWIGGHLFPNQFKTIPSAEEGPLPPHTAPSWRHSIQVTVVGLALWWIPVLFIGYLTGWDRYLFQEALFFSKAALLTFGGAYAVLSYVTEHSLAQGWIQPGQMIDGLGLAETTPGPLIMVLQFVGFLGGWHFPDGLSPLLSATLGAFVAPWTTFVPSFLFIFLGAPYIEQFRGHLNLTTALSTVTASVVGVILNLAVWFAIQVLFRPHGGFDPIVLLISLVAFYGIWRWKWEVVPVVLGSGLFGLIYQWLF